MELKSFMFGLEEIDWFKEWKPTMGLSYASKAIGAKERGESVPDIEMKGPEGPGLWWSKEPHITLPFFLHSMPFQPP